METPDALTNRCVSPARRRGRPPLDVPNPRVQITLPPDVFDEFDRVARARGETLASVIRAALRGRIS